MYRLSLWFRFGALLILLACGACAAQHQTMPRLMLPTASTPAPPPPAPTGPWWRGSGDPLLDRLVTEALPHHAPTLCVPPHGGVKWRVARLLGVADRPDSVANQSAQRARARMNYAGQIAEAYLRVRAWQARLTERQAESTVLKDNKEIAHFRGEAGLVPVLDGDMATVMAGLNGADIPTAHAELTKALGDLSVLTGQDEDRLDAMVRAAPPTSLVQDGGDMALKMRVQQSDALVIRADKAQADARLAYRNGAANFATLYVAEAADLGAKEARIAARTAEALATTHLWIEQGRSEVPHGGRCEH